MSRFAHVVVHLSILCALLLDLLVQLADLLIILVLEVLRVRDRLNRVEQQGELLLQNSVLHVLQLVCLLHPKDLIRLVVQLAQLKVKFVLAPSSHALIEIGHLPHYLTVVAHRVDKETEMVECV